MSKKGKVYLLELTTRSLMTTALALAVLANSNLLDCSSHLIQLKNFALTFILTLIFNLYVDLDIRDRI